MVDGLRDHSNLSTEVRGTRIATEEVLENMLGSVRRFSCENAPRMVWPPRLLADRHLVEN